MKRDSDLLDRFAAHLESSGIARATGRWLVGYSGGADSTCLVHLLHRTGRDIVAAHLHHGQRPEADGELDRCRAFCETIQVAFVSGAADVPGLARELKVGVEEAGREARYAFFRRACAADSCQGTLTAHTRSDLVETVIFNLARGSGLTGLAGIPERRDDIERPLLPFSRGETRAYCVEFGLWFHDDPSNEDVNFARPRIRLRVMRELAQINPDAELAIARLAETVREEDGFLDGMAAAALERTETPLNGDLSFLTRHVEVAFDRARLTHLPEPLLRRAVRLAAGALGGRLSHDHTTAISHGIRHGANGSITADGGVVVAEWGGDQVAFRSLASVPPFEFPLTVPGETVSDELGWKFGVRSSPTAAVRMKRRSTSLTISTRHIDGSLFFRSMRPGDRMEPLGFNGSRKLSDLVSEAGLTLAARSRLPIVCDARGPLWAPGVCVDGRAAAPNSNSSVIIVQFGPVHTSNDHN